MALVHADFVEETTQTEGTSTLSLDGATTGNRSFVAGIGSGNTCVYALRDANGTAWEVGVGTVTDSSPDTLSRNTIIASSNAGAAISLSEGTHTVYCTWSSQGGAKAYSAAQTSTENTWTARQSFLTVTGDSETVTLSSNAATIPLDGRCYVLDLDSATNNVTLSFSTPSGASYAFCTIVIIQGSTARSVDFYDTVDQTDQELPTANNARSTWAIITPDSGTTYQLHGCGA